MAITLSVLVPVYNEEKTISLMMTRLLKVKAVKEIIIINDGSTDKTRSKLNKYKQKKVTVIHKKNGGKGSAIVEGLKKVKGNYVLIQDADLEYDPSDIPDLLEPIKKNKAKVVFGSRFLGAHSNLLFWHRLGNSFLNFVTNVLYNTTLSDLETCYKVIPTSLLKKLRITAKGFDIEPEITCKLLRKGVRIFEVPISYVGRDFSEGKKITWRDGIKALQVIITNRFS